jgi:hypothetical protein
LDSNNTGIRLLHSKIAASFTGRVINFTNGPAEEFLKLENEIDPNGEPAYWDLE